MPKADRFVSLDAMRGLCACVVAIGHLWTSNPLTTSALLRHSYLFVDFFFVLSGFVICWNYENRLSTWLDVKKFTVMRLGRLYPLHATMLAALLALELLAFYRYPHLLSHQPFGPENSVSSLWSGLLLIHSMNLHDRLTWNDPSWSISTELWAYASFAAVCLAVRTRALLLLLAVPILYVILLGSKAGMGSTYDHGFVRCLVGFCIGVLCCKAYQRFPLRLGKLLSTAMECLALGAVAIIIMADWASPFLAPIAIAFAVFFCAAEGGFVSMFLRTRPLVWLGHLSYSIYMTHWLVLSGFWIATNYLRSGGLDLWGLLVWDGRAIQVYGRDAVEGAVYVLLFLACTIALSTITYRFIEQPGRAWSRRYAALLGVQRKIPRDLPAALR